MQLTEMNTVPDVAHQVWVRVNPDTVPQRMLDREAIDSTLDGEPLIEVLEERTFPLSDVEHQAFLSSNTIPTMPTRLAQSADVWLHARCFTVATIENPQDPQDRRLITALNIAEYVERPGPPGDPVQYLYIRVSNNAVVLLRSADHNWAIDGNGLTISTITSATHGLTVIGNEITVTDPQKLINSGLQNNLVYDNSQVPDDTDRVAARGGP